MSRSRTVHLGFAGLAWLPMLWTRPGEVAADTRQNLLLDPVGFLERARLLWDPLSHFGTVTHQNLGLLLPMGTWFAAGDLLGLPTWVTQRLWLGALVFVAAAGVLHLGRTLGWALATATTAAAFYALSPYQLQYVTRTSVLLLPFVGMPWAISFVIRAARSGSWRHPALFALVLLLTGSANATATILAGLGPLLWLVYAAATEEVRWRAALRTAARCGALAAGCSLWWVVALLVQGRHGLPILAYTETQRDVATTSGATEVLRGLGYWVFYGNEAVDPNMAPAVAYTQNPLLLTITYGIPVLGLASAAFVRFRGRGYFVALIAVGTLVATGAHALGGASILSRTLIDLGDSSVVLALRSSTRAVPCIVLGLAACIGHAVTALSSWRPQRRQLLVGGAVLLAVAALPALPAGHEVDPTFARPSDLPDQWTEVADYLDQQPGDGAVLELPGSPFAAYRWGNAAEPVLTALVDRPVIAREQMPFGSGPSADLLIALDRRFQEGVGEPEALAPIARLFGAGWVLVRNDLAFERYSSVRPGQLQEQLGAEPPGLHEVATFGTPSANVPDPRTPMVDPVALGLDDPTPTLPPVELLAVDGATDGPRLESGTASLVVDGDGEGLVDAAAAGLLDTRPILYGTTLLDDPDELTTVLAGDADIIVTDTNRIRTRRWRAVRWSTGRTEAEGAEPQALDPGDSVLAVFDDAPPRSQTSVEQRGATVTANTYGGPLTIDPAVRPAAALDGRQETAWMVGPIIDPVGSHLTVRPDAAVATPTITVQQRARPGDRRITAVDVSVDGGPAQRVVLDDTSLAAPGQTITVGDGSIGEVDLRIAGVEMVPGRSAGDGPVGIVEVGLGGTRVEELTVLPTALIDAIGAGGEGHRLTFVLTRLRSDPAEPLHADEELALHRLLTVPTGRPFALQGTARLAAGAPGTTLDQLTGVTGAVATASSSLPGSRAHRPSAAADSDPATAWVASFDDVGAPWIDLLAPSPATVDHLDLQVVADGLHSIPTRLTVDVDGTTQLVDVPVVEPGPEPGHTTTVRVPLAPVTGTRLHLTVTASRPVDTLNDFDQSPVVLPVGIAEVGAAGFATTPAVATVDTGCRRDLLSVDGRPVAVRITGPTATAVSGGALSLAPCDGDLALDAGEHVVATAPGLDTGIDLDRLVLGAPGDDGDTPAAATATPMQDVQRHGNRFTAVVPAGPASWLVLPQSHEDGWTARLDDEDLGDPVLIDGASNGWRIPAADEVREVSFAWAPQRTVDRGLLATALVVLLCLVLVRRSRPDPATWRLDPAVSGVEPLTAPPPRLDRGGIVTALSVGAAGVLAIGPAYGLVALLATVLVLVVPWGATAGRAAVVLAIAVAGGSRAVSQVLDERPHNLAWLRGSAGAHKLALLGVLLLVAVVSATRRATAGPPTSKPPGPLPSTRSRFLRASAIGGGAALLLFGWVLTMGRFDFTPWQRVGDFYDAQAHSWVHGRWDMSDVLLGIERFEHNGKSYMYQGPWPAILRLPVAAVTERFDGRLTKVSMLLGFTVAVAGFIALHWRVRRSLRGDAPFTRAEAWGSGLLTFAVTAGSALGYVATRSWVYHEAIVWGVAWALVASASIIGYLQAGSRRSLVLASLATMLSLCSRASVGLGPFAALLLVAGGQALRWLAARFRSPGSRIGAFLGWFSWLAPPGDRPRPVRDGALALVPMAVYSATNYIKFGSLYSVPFRGQGFTIVDEARQRMLDSNNGTLFGLKYLPSTVPQYLRPDALDLTKSFPFVDFPDLATVRGGVIFDLVDRATSVPSAMPALVVLTAVAALVLLRRRPSVDGPGAARLRGPVLAAGVGAFLVLPFAYIANRYLADMVPLLGITAAVGAQYLFARAPHWRRPWTRRVLAGSLVVLIVAGTWVNVSLALIYQRLYSPNVHEDVIADFLDTRYDIPQALGLDPTIPISQGDHLPEDGYRGQLFVVGDCDGLYLSDGMEENAVKVTDWNAVERTEAVGVFRRRIRFEDLPVGTRQPLASWHGPSGGGVLYVEQREGFGRIFGYLGDPSAESPVRYVPAGRQYELQVILDAQVDNVQVMLDGQVMYEGYAVGIDGPAVFGIDVAGEPSVADAYTGEVLPSPHRTRVCEELRDEAGLPGDQAGS